MFPSGQRCSVPGPRLPHKRGFQRRCSTVISKAEPTDAASLKHKGPQGPTQDPQRLAGLWRGHREIGMPGGEGPHALDKGVRDLMLSTTEVLGVSSF